MSSAPPSPQASHPRPRGAAGLAPAAMVLAGSALLFAMEPLVGRLALPHYGGSPQVWNACLMTFQGLLLLGYGVGLVYGVMVVRRAVLSLPRNPVVGIMAGFLLWNVLWIVVVGNAVELGENNRFRFVADPLCLALVGIFVDDRVRRLRRSESRR